MRVTNWLDVRPDEEFIYKTDTTVIVLKTFSTQPGNNKSVSAFSSLGTFKLIKSDPIKRPLREKAHQHTSIRKANYPYVIALFLEPWQLSAEEVARAWLGEEVWTVDFSKGQVVGTSIDKTGIHFLGADIRHTTVTGTLVFKGKWAEVEESTFLRAWYIENPFAKVPIDPMFFPAEARYVVSDKSPMGFRMTWTKS